MSASFYDLLKYAATGIASPDMTAFDKLRARAMSGGYPVRTIEGVPPISFRSDGKPLSAWTVWGNGQQTGTPSPQNIIMPELVGVRTGNMLSVPNVSATVGTVTVTNTNGRITVTGTTNVEISSTNTAWKNAFSFMLKAGTYYVSGSASGGVSSYVRKSSDDSMVSLPNASFTLAEDTLCYIGFYVYRNTNNDFNIMLNLGSTALPYEPYGYAINITTSQTVPVYLGQTQTVRKIRKLVLTGTENWTLEATNMYTMPSEMPLLGYRDAYCDRYALGNSYAEIYASDYTFGISRRPALFVHDNRFSTVADFKAYLASEYAAEHPVCVWHVLATPETGIFNEPLAKIGDYADEFHSTDAGIIIPTAKGENTLTVDTDLQPSKVSITGTIKE